MSDENVKDIDICSKYSREDLICYYEKRFYNKINRMIIPVDFSPEIMENSKYFIYYIQKYGFTGIIKVNGVEYAMRDICGSDMPNAYYDYEKFTITNPYLKLNKSVYTKGKDVAIFYHDSQKIGLDPIIHKYATMIVDIGISLNILTVIDRAPYVLSASDESTRETLLGVINEVKNGKLSVSLDRTKLLNGTGGIETLQFGTSTANLKDLIELENYVTGMLDMELGLISNYNGKREYVSDGEHSIDSISLVPNTDDILKTLNDCCKEYNEMFGHNAHFELGDVWKVVEENAEEINDEETEYENEQEEQGKEDDENETIVDRDTKE